MDPSSLIPTLEAIPVHWAWFEILSLATFTLHLLFMNAVLGGTAITLVELAAKPDSALPKAASLALPSGLALTVNLGVPPLLFLQVLYSSFIYPSTTLMSVYWIAITFLVMAAYYGLYLVDFKYASLGGSRLPLLALVLALLMGTAFVLVNNMTLMLTPKLWTAYFDNPHGTVLAVADPMFWPRYLHFVLGSVAVGGLALALLGRYKARRGDPGAGAMVETGMKWFTRATMVQMADGVWFLLSIRRDAMLMFLGDDALYTVVFLASLALAVAALWAGARRRVWTAAALAGLTVLAMAGNRALLRAAYLRPHFTLDDLPVAPQASPLILFLAAFAVGLAVLAWMLKLYVRSGKEA